MSLSAPIDLDGAKILVVDDVAANRNLLCEILEPEGYTISAAPTGEVALRVAQANPPDLILLDVMMPEMDGFETCRRLKQDKETERIPVVFITAKNEVRHVVEGFQAGGVDYLTKPVQTEEVVVRVRTHLKIHALTRALIHKNQELEEEIHQRRIVEKKVSVLSQREAGKWGIDGFIGKSEAVRRVVESVRKVQRFSTSVLITGESGTGKELIARAIHYGSPLLEGPFVPVNCAAVPRELAESAFFGHIKGAFSGAVGDRKGYFEQAHEGTLFLDEIGDMPFEIQAKLLRVLEEGEVMPVGGAKARKVKVRVLAGTNADLQTEIEAGKFRNDLYYRLAGYLIEIPPLCDRREDILLLAEHFIRRLTEEMGIGET